MDQNHSQQHIEVFSKGEWNALIASGSVDLSPRLSEIAYRLTCGYSDRQIGLDLGIKLPTVRTHMGRLFSKLGVQDRQEVALFFFRLHRSMYMAEVSS
jgi:DNA-binding NarL/FixJ family response regulator